MITLSPTPPADWDERVSEPCQTTGFARAMATMGYSALYVSNERAAALALVRGATGPFRRVAARANLCASGCDAAFGAEALEALRRWGLPYVKVGDTMWGVAWPDLPGAPHLRPRPVIKRHTFVLDLRQSEAEILKQMDGAERKIRKADREGVTVTEASSPADLDTFWRLSAETSARVRSRTAYTDYPSSLFHALHRELAPRGIARFYLAWHKDEPLAGCLFLCSRTTMLYYLGGSTRDRELTAKQAPAAVFWHAIRQARVLGMERFDLGGCTPTSDPNDARYGVYTFKKRWGGRIETFYNHEVVLSPIAVMFQEQVLSPAWDRLHPLYFRLMHRIRKPEPRLLD